MKYVLGGGHMWSAADSGLAYCKEISKGLPRSITILNCMFAKYPGDIHRKHAHDKHMFTSNLPNHDINFILARRHTFMDQVKKADILNFHGGHPRKLVRSLNKFHSWNKHFGGKVMSGGSAGANALSTYYYDISRPMIRKGLGLAKAKTVVHFESENWKLNWKSIALEIEEYGEPMPVYLLSEGEFVVINDPA